MNLEQANKAYEDALHEGNLEEAAKLFGLIENLETTMEVAA